MLFAWSKESPIEPRLAFISVTNNLHSSLILIHSHLLSIRSQSVSMMTREYALSTLESISRQSAIILQGLRDGNRGTPDEYCPLLSGWFYRSTAVSILLGQDAMSDELSNRIQVSKQGLDVVSKRWLVVGKYLHLQRETSSLMFRAGTYLRLLEKRTCTRAPLVFPHGT